MPFYRYIIIQLLSYIIDISLFWMFVNILNVNPIISNGIGKIIAGIACFFGHKYFSFEPTQDLNIGKQASLYSVLLCINIPISSLLLSIVIDYIDFILISKVIVDGILVLLNFIICNKIVFSNNGMNKDGI